MCVLQYKIHTVTDDARFVVRDFFVRRRYKDFEWLRSQLVSSFQGAIVPPLPPPDQKDRFSTQFIQRRQARLELFLRRVATHTTLASSPDLVTFLEAKVWELQTAKNASNIASWTSSLLDSTDASIKRVATALRTKAPDDEDIERLRSFSEQ